MTTIHISKASVLFAELSGEKNDSSGHTKTSDHAGLFQSLLAGMHEPTVPSKEILSETEANQGLLEEEGSGETIENLKTDYVQVMHSIPNVEWQETSAELGEVDSNPMNENQEKPTVNSQLISASIPLFAMRTHFEGGDGRKFISASTPILSTKQLESLAKWSVNKLGETKAFDDIKLRPVLESDLRPILDSKNSPVLETDLSPILDSENSPILETDLSPILDSETSPILETETRPILKPATTESLVTVPLQAPELPVEFQQDGVESLDVTKPEFEKFRNEFARNMTVPLRQAITDGGQTLRIQVFPENLGHIDIVVSMQDGKMHAQLTASSTITKEVLEMQLPQLRQSLQDQGIQLDQLDVDLFGEERFDRERPNEQSTTGQNSSQTNRQAEWSDDLDEEDIPDEETSQVVDYSV